MLTKECVCPKEIIDKKSQWWLFGTIPYPSLTSSGQQSLKYEVDVRLDNYWGDRKSPWRKFHSISTVISLTKDTTATQCSYITMRYPNSHPPLPHYLPSILTSFLPPFPPVSPPLSLSIPLSLPGNKISISRSSIPWHDILPRPYSEAKQFHPVGPEVNIHVI